jgi:hypothetical protein
MDAAGEKAHERARAAHQRMAEVKRTKTKKGKVQNRTARLSRGHIGAHVRAGNIYAVAMLLSERVYGFLIEKCRIRSGEVRGSNVGKCTDGDSENFFVDVQKHSFTVAYSLRKLKEYVFFSLPISDASRTLGTFLSKLRRRQKAEWFYFKETEGFGFTWNSLTFVLK